MVNKVAETPKVIQTSQMPVKKTEPVIKTGEPAIKTGRI